MLATDPLDALWHDMQTHALDLQSMPPSELCKIRDCAAVIVAGYDRRGVTPPRDVVDLLWAARHELARVAVRS